MADSANQAPIGEPEIRVTALTVKADAALDQAYNVSSNAMPIEDEFIGMYYGEGGDGQGTLIQPPYDPARLKQIIQENNTLLQCVSAMEVNIDGTGYEVEPQYSASTTTTNEERIKAVKEFFDEPYPGESFVTQRRRLRRDLEEMGYGFLEVIENARGEIVFLRNLPAETMRLGRLSNPTPVTKEIMRSGRMVKARMNVRERHFAQKVGTDVVYFKEFGASRDIDKKSGDWALPGQRLPADKRGTSVLYFTIHRDARTPYGIPRWINQAPSAIGSRKAEELNLEFFKSGGVPPVIIMLEGGQVAADSRKYLEQMLTGAAAKKTRAAIIEVMSTSGSLDSNSTARVRVERFGSETQKDSMFENYDVRCEERVRSSFRLPPLFVGKANDYSFASAYASYTVAEMQVFKPEREEFDEIINVTLMRALGYHDLVFRSLPMTISDSTVQLKGLELMKGDPRIEFEQYLKQVNEVCELNLRPLDQGQIDAITVALTDAMSKVLAANKQTTPPSPEGQQPGQLDQTGNPAAQPGPDSTPVPLPSNAAKADDFELRDLAVDWAEMLGLINLGRKFDKHHVDLVRRRVDSLSKAEKDTFTALMVTVTTTNAGSDVESLMDVMGCSAGHVACGH